MTFNLQEYNKLKKQRYRNKALEQIDPNLKCKRCGCDDIRFLEINHINGGGGKEHKKENTPIANQILHRGRSTHDLELLCRPCNNIHYLELKYKRPLPMQVIWTGDQS